MKILARYLKHHPRMVTEYRRQSATPHLETWVDTDYAGCPRTRQSTSGGIVRMGNHIIKSWSATQKVIALASGEAEYYGMVKGASMAKGTQAIMSDMGMEMEIQAIGHSQVHTDSAAAKGMAL